MKLRNIPKYISLTCKDLTKGIRKLRSSRWPEFEHELIIKRGGKCEATGRTDHLQGHHIIAFHVDPSKELDENNVIILTQSKEGTAHYSVGHCGRSWKINNENVSEDAAESLKMGCLICTGKGV